jgi:hypothetical protein
VIVRVQFEGHGLAVVRRKAPYWIGPLWHGVAHLDGHKGKEVVVGQTMGVHAHFYRVLTWRKRGLITLDAPGRSKYWYIDGAYTITAGWQVRPKDPPGTIRQRIAGRHSGRKAKLFDGRVLTFDWTRDGWQKVSTKRVSGMHQRRAYSWGGFDIPGLPRW